MKSINYLNKGSRGSDAVIYNGIAFFAVTPLHPYDGSLSCARQMQQLLLKLEKRLTDVGSDKSSLLFVNIILADMQDYSEMNEVWDNWIDQNAPAARACFEARLASPEMKVELIVHAAVQV